MTYKEILERLKTVFESVSDFAYNEIPYSENYSAEALKAEDVRQEWLVNNPNPGYDNNDEYRIWAAEFYKIPSKYNVAKKEWFVNNNIPYFEEVHQEGGEGQGDHWESVKLFPEHNIYIKVVGHYSSYNGTDFYNDWGCCYNVTPKEKTVTVYE